MLDEMTAALPANLTERVLEVVGRKRGGDRFRHIHLPPDDRDRRGLRPRLGPAQGRPWASWTPTRGSEDRIVDLMLGQTVQQTAQPTSRRADARRKPPTPQRNAARGLSPRNKIQDVSFDLYPGKVRGMVALEGQGQDELFDVLAGPRSQVSGARSSTVSGRFRHPADAILAGLVYEEADRAEALLMQRSVRENIALPFITHDQARAPRHCGRGAEAGGGCDRAPADRHPGPGRSATSIGREPTEGDDRPLGRRRSQDNAVLRPNPRHRHRDQDQIYVLLRDLAEAGAAILLYTSDSRRSSSRATGRRDLRREGRGRDRRRGRDQPALLRAAYDLQPTRTSQEIAAERRSQAAPRPAAAAPSTRRAEPPATTTRTKPRPTEEPRRAARRRIGRAWARRNAWTLGLLGFLTCCCVHQAHPADLRRARHPGPGHRGAPPRPGGGRPGDRRDLRRDRPAIGAMMALTSVVSATYEGPAEEVGVLVLSASCCLGWCSGPSTAPSS